MRKDVLLILAVLSLAACKDKENPVALAPSASSLSASTPAPTTNKILKLTVDPKSKATIDMPAPKEHITAGTDAAAGSLDVDLMNLANSRGEVKMDLATLKTGTFKDESKDSTQTGHARCWLEV